MKTWKSTKSPEYFAAAKERFERQINKTPTCWLWTGKGRAGPYGQMSYRNSMILVHRLAILFEGIDIPSNMDVLHRCDTPLCVNPDHLFLGDHRDNMQDKAKKGRAPSKLTAAQVVKISQELARGRSANSLSIEYGVVPHTIGDIRDGVTWTHITKRNRLGRTSPPDRDGQP